MGRRAETSDEAADRNERMDVGRAAVLVGRHPETIRRWVWSGRLAAHRRGNRLFVARAEVEALARQEGSVISLAEWADRARAARASTVGPDTGTSAADLVIADRTRRSTVGEADAGR